MHWSECSKADILHCEDHKCYLLRDLKTYFGFNRSELGGDDAFFFDGSANRKDKLQVRGRRVLEMAALSVKGDAWVYAQKYRAMCTSITAGAHFAKKHLWYGKLKEAADSTCLVVYLHNCVGYAVTSPKCCRDAKTWLLPLLQLLVPCKDADQCLCNSLCSVIKFPKWGTEDLPEEIAKCIHPWSAHARHFAAIGDRTLFLAALDFYTMLKQRKGGSRKNMCVEKATKFVQNADDLSYYAKSFLDIPAVFQKRYPTRDIADSEVAQILKAIVGVVAAHKNECDVGPVIFKSIREVLISRDLISLGENVSASADLDKFLAEIDRTIIPSATNVGGRDDNGSDLPSLPLPSIETDATVAGAPGDGGPMWQLPRTDTESDQLTQSSSHTSAHGSARSTEQRVHLLPVSSHTDPHSSACSTDRSIRLSSHIDSNRSARSTDQSLRPSSRTDSQRSARSTDQFLALSPNADARCPLDNMSVASEGDLEPIRCDVTLPMGRKFFAIPSQDDLSSFRDDSVIQSEVT